MPINKKDYPDNWPSISLSVREAAGWKCEWCGVNHNTVVQRFHGNDWNIVERIRADESSPWEDTQGMTWKRLKFHGLTRIILTVAHLDRDKKNNDRDNLAALCQRCHLGHDKYQHLRNRRYGRDHDREHQMKFF